MIRLRRGTVLRITSDRPGIQEVDVEVDGVVERALAYTELCGTVDEGATVVLNTTALAYGLGTGGYHLVVAVEGAELDPLPEGHVIKARYTPLQAKVQTVEEPGSPHREAFERTRDLDGLPVVWTPLHSMVAAACAGARAAGASRVVYVMTDGAALPVWLSRQVHALRESGLLDAVVSCGQAFGGDLEAVSVFSGLLAARGVAGADVVIVGDGPGKVGTATRWGASDVASGVALNAVSSLKGRPIASLRLNFADPAYRHHGLSPHSLTVLRDVVLAPVAVAMPVLPDDRRREVFAALRDARIEDRHHVVEVSGEPALELLRDRGVEAESMGRRLEEEPALFLAAGAAGVLGARMAAGTARWKHVARTS
ncbi:MAG: DUF3866 family protein [Actinomycetota bacterium]